MHTIIRCIDTLAPNTPPLGIPTPARAYHRPMCHWRAVAPCMLTQHNCFAKGMATDEKHAPCTLLQKAQLARGAQPAPLLEPFQMQQHALFASSVSTCRLHMANQAAQCALQHSTIPAQPQWQAWMQGLCTSARAKPPSAAAPAAPPSTAMQQVLCDKTAAVASLIIHARAAVLHEILEGYGGCTFDGCVRIHTHPCTHCTSHRDHHRPSPPTHLQWNTLMKAIARAAAAQQHVQTHRGAARAALTNAVLSMHGIIKEQVHLARWVKGLFAVDLLAVDLLAVGHSSSTIAPLVQPTERQLGGRDCRRFVHTTWRPTWHWWSRSAVMCCKRRWHRRMSACCGLPGGSRCLCGHACRRCCVINKVGMGMMGLMVCVSHLYALATLPHRTHQCNGQHAAHK